MSASLTSKNLDACLPSGYFLHLIITDANRSRLMRGKNAITFGFYGKLSAAALVFSLLTALSACGVKGAPLPPKENKPPQAVNVSAVSHDGRVHISWLLPAVVDPQFKPVAFQVVRNEWPDADPSPETVKKSILADIEAPEAEPGSEASRMVFIDELLTKGRFYQYVISSYDSEKRFSDPFVIERFEMRYPMDKITGLKVSSIEGSVRLAWNPPPQQSMEQLKSVMDSMKNGGNLDLEKLKESSEALPDSERFYVNVYRAMGKDGQFSRSPINSKPLEANEFEDSDAQPGKTWRYKVCAVRIDAGGMQLEGPLGLEVSAEITDHTPPPAPLIISAEAVDGGIKLRWKPVEDKSLLGYWLERRIDGKFSDVSGFLTVDEFTDRKIPAAVPGVFVYRVVVRDQAGNSAVSAEQTVEYAPQKESDKNSDAALPAENTAPTQQQSDAVPLEKK